MLILERRGTILRLNICSCSIFTSFRENILAKRSECVCMCVYLEVMGGFIKNFHINFYLLPLFLGPALMCYVGFILE